MSGAVERQNRKRTVISLLLALFLHGMAFLLFHSLFPLRLGEVPHYSGPITVVIGEMQPPARSVPDRKGEQKQGAEASFEEKRKEIAETTQEREHEPPVQEEAEPWDRRTDLHGTESGEKTHNQTIVEEESKQRGKPAIEERAVQQVSERPEHGEEGIEEREKPLPPRAGEKEEPALIDLGRLDEAIEQSKRTGEGAEERLDAQTSRAVSAGLQAFETPTIYWDNPAEGRTLLVSGGLPHIPRWLKKEGLNLKVVVSFAVTPEGYTTSVRIVESSGYPEVDASVLEVVRKYIFNPIEGTDTVTGTIPYLFTTK